MENVKNVHNIIVVKYNNYRMYGVCMYVGRELYVNDSERCSLILYKGSRKGKMWY